MGERWVIGGDFNMIMHMKERSSVCTNYKEIEEFREMIDKLDLVDFPLVGGRWT